MDTQSGHIKSLLQHLFLMSDHDPTASIEDAEYLQQLIPNSDLQIIEGAGHWPQWEKPEEFNEIQVNFAKV